MPLNLLGLPPSNTIGAVLDSSEVSGDTLPANAVFIGIGSLWENPFRPGIHGSHEECVARYELLLANAPEQLEMVDHLKDKDLICHGADRRCHGHVLTQLAALNYRQRLDWAEKIKALYAPESGPILEHELGLLAA